MSLVNALLISLGTVMVGVSSGWAAYVLLGRSAYTQGRLDERRESALTAAGYTASVTWNAPEIPIGRHRSPNNKPAASPVMPPRPVLERPSTRTH